MLVFRKTIVQTGHNIFAPIQCALPNGFSNPGVRLTVMEVFAIC